jgi:hypothetical protein
MITGIGRMQDMWPDPSRMSRTAGWPGPALLFGMMLLAAPGRAAAQVTGPSVEELTTNAERQGALRVIVELRVDSTGPPTGAAIAAAQDSLLDELGGTSHRLIRRYTTVPFIALEVSAEALRRLAGSPRVAGIREDRVLRPQGAPGTP